MLKAVVLLLLLAPAVAPARVTDAGVRLAETAAHDEIVNLLKEKDIAFRERELMTDYGAFGISIYVSIPPAVISETQGLFILAVPISDGVEAVTPSWGQMLAINFIDRILAETPAFETLVCFLGDSWMAGGERAGLQALLDDIRDRESAALVYCDFSAPPAVFTVFRGRGGTSATLESAASFFEACNEADIPCLFDSGCVLSADGTVPVLYISEAASAPFSARQTGREITDSETSALLYDYAAKLTLDKSDMETAEYNYAYIGFDGKGFFISEYNLVILALFSSIPVSILCFFLYNAAKSRRKRFLAFIFDVGLLLIIPVLFTLYTNNGENMPDSAKSGPKTVRIMNGNTEAERYFTVNTESRRFLERKIIKINVDARLPPLRYKLFFTPRDMENSVYFIYDAPMPYSGDGNRIEFILGYYPPNPLDMEISLPQDMAGSFTLEVLFENDLNIIEIFTPT
ncbi:MAG: hypothetical protein LBB22_04145 [Treponema sp.]|jgi:hypothetical protein|nr:hypothetical protein [Treponema sp.]